MLANLLRTLSLSGLLLSAIPVAAAPTPTPTPTPAASGDAKAYFRSGTSHYNLSEFPQALADFKEAYRLRPDPVFLFNVAQCHRRLGDPEQAATFFRSYLRESRSAPNRADVERLITEMDALAAQRRSTQAAADEAQRTEAARRTSAPERAAAAPSDTTATLVARPPVRTPLVKRGWFWGAVGGGVVLVGTAVALGVVFGRPRDPEPTLGAVGVN